MRRSYPPVDQTGHFGDIFSAKFPSVLNLKLASKVPGKPKLQYEPSSRHTKIGVFWKKAKRGRVIPGYPDSRTH